MDAILIGIVALVVVPFVAIFVAVAVVNIVCLFFLLGGSALRVPPAETRLTVYRRLYI